MRVFLAGGSGVLGVRLIPLLVAAGHSVAATTRSPEKTELVAALAAEPVVVDILDADAIRAAIAGVAPDAVLHYVTNLPDDPARIGELAAGNNAVRRAGTRNLIAAAQAAGAGRFVAQSVAWPLPGDAGAAVEELEQLTLGAGGTVVRYGQLYGPGTYHPDRPPPPPRVHVDAAARRTLPALEAPAGVLTITEDPG